MAAEAAEGPSLPPPLAGEAEAEAHATVTPEKRAPAERGEKEQGGEERLEPKRRRARARISALESVPRAAEVAAAAAATAESGSGCDGGEGSSFSFHARACSSAQTTPKFGSFDPGATAELVAFHLMKASRRLAKSSGTEEAGDRRTGAGGCDEKAAAAAEGRDGNSR
ncbi:hypothetical protein BS78_09G188100 [Paspalum vaginatum]|nr:hypothetical protein BS78_09G188100 [Paspalum vaginatum]